MQQRGATASTCLLHSPALLQHLEAVVKLGADHDGALVVWVHLLWPGRGCTSQVASSA